MKNKHYYYYNKGIKDSDLNTAILAQQAIYLKVIKNILMAFFIMSILAALGIILL